MANFLEGPRRLNNYISQIPVDVYSSVGMQKQLEYQQGVAKVKSIIQNSEGLGGEMVRDIDRTYLNSRVDEMTQKINKIGNADFSNESLINQIEKLSSSLAGDQLIQNAISNSKKYLKDETAITQAKEKGQWSVQNEWFLRKQMSPWLNDTTMQQSYNTSGFIPYSDVLGDVVKLYKEKKPNMTLVQGPNGDFYSYENLNGQAIGKDSRTLTETTIKELRPDQIAEEINALLTPSQREQLAINSAYQYRDIVTPIQVKSLIDTHFKNSEEYYENLLEKEKLSLTLSADTDSIKQITRNINDIQKRKNELASTKKGLFEASSSNLEGVKSSIYFNDFLKNMSTHLGYREQSVKVVDNPSYKAQLEEYKAWTQLQKSINPYRSGSSKSKKKDGEDGDDEDSMWESATGTVLPIPETERKQVKLSDFKEELLTNENQLRQQQYELIYRKIGNSLINKVVKDIAGDGTRRVIYTAKPGKIDQINAVLAAWNDSYKKGDPNLDLIIQETMSEQEDRKMVNSKLAQVINNLEKEAEHFAKQMPDYQKSVQQLKQYDLMPAIRYKNITISPRAIRIYQDLKTQLVHSTPSLGVGMPGGYNIDSPTEMDLERNGITKQEWNVLREIESNAKGVEYTHFANMIDHYGRIHSGLSKIETAKKNYIDEQIVRYKSIFNEVAQTVHTSKPEELHPVVNFVSTLAANAMETEMGGSTNWKQVREMISAENNKNTSFSYIQDRMGNLRLRLNNPDVSKGAPQYIDIDSQTAKINNITAPDPLSITRNILDLNENVKTGSTFEESIPTKTAHSGKYTIRHQVEQHNGKYKVTLYAIDKNDKEKTVHTIDINTILFPNWTALTNFLTTDVSDKFIESYLLPQNTPQKNSIQNPFANNVLIESHAGYKQ